MMVLSQDFIATERRAVVLDAIDCLRALPHLNPTQQAALRHLQDIYARSIRHASAVITHEAIANAVAVAHRAAGAR